MLAAREMGLYDEEPPRPVKGQRPQWGFRPDADVEAYLEPSRHRGRGYFTKFVLRLIKLGRDATEGMGPIYKEVLGYAKAHGLTEGQAIAKFAVKGWQCRNVDCAESASQPKSKK